MPTLMLLLQALHSADHRVFPYVFTIVLKVTHMAYLEHPHTARHRHAHNWTPTRSPLKALERGVGRTPRLG